MNTLESVEAEIARIEAEVAATTDADRRNALHAIVHKLRLSRAALERQSAETVRHVEPGAPVDPYS
jgi:hypothetical protein